MASWNFPSLNGIIRTSKNLLGGRAKFDYSACSAERTITFPDASITVASAATLSGHLDGGASKHDATEIDFELADGSKVMIQAASDTVEAALIDLDARSLPKAGGQISGNITCAAAETFDGRDLSVDGSKLDGIEALADVTDATNVAAAGAVMEADTTTAAMSFVIDEDNMVSNLDTKVPTQQSVKAYVDAAVVGLLDFKGGYDANTNTPDLDTAPSGVLKSDVYVVTAAGTFFTVAVEVGDQLIAKVDAATLETDWTIVQANLTATTIKTQYESNADTNAFTDAEQTKLGGIEALADVTDFTNVNAALAAASAQVLLNGQNLGNIGTATVTNLTVSGAASQVNLDPGLGGDFIIIRVDSGVVPLSTIADNTDLGLSIPVGAIILGASSKIVDAVTGVSAAGVTVSLDFAAGSTMSVADYISGGDGNVVANAKVKALYSYADSNVVSAIPADLKLTFSGGVDNTPTAGSIRAVVHYITLADLD